MGRVMVVLPIQSAYVDIEIFRWGGDPYLHGEGSYQTIMGIQSQGVQAVAKHFINKLVAYLPHDCDKAYLFLHILSEQEHSRMSSSSNVDDR